MNLFMAIVLILISILAVRGTLYNKKTNNKPGFIIGGIFTIGLIGVTLLSVFDLFLGIDILLPYLPW